MFSNYGVLPFWILLITIPESKFTKQKKKSESISENKKYTEKTSMSMIAGDRAPFSYYKPIKSNQKEEVINLDNMSLQVPYKGMEIDIMDSENDFYSTLMILLLDGNKIELQDFRNYQTLQLEVSDNRLVIV